MYKNERLTREDDQNLIAERVKEREKERRLWFPFFFRATGYHIYSVVQTLLNNICACIKINQIDTNPQDSMPR